MGDAKGDESDTEEGEEASAKQKLATKVLSRTLRPKHA